MTLLWGDVTRSRPRCWLFSYHLWAPRAARRLKHRGRIHLSAQRGERGAPQHWHLSVQHLADGTGSAHAPWAGWTVFKALGEPHLCSSGDRVSAGLRASSGVHRRSLFCSWIIVRLLLSALRSDMPRSFLVKSKRAHSYHQPRALEDDYSRLDSILAQICSGMCMAKYSSDLTNFFRKKREIKGKNRKRKKKDIFVKYHLTKMFKILSWLKNKYVWAPDRPSGGETQIKGCQNEMKWKMKLPAHRQKWFIVWRTIVINLTLKCVFPPEIWLNINRFIPPKIVGIVRIYMDGSDGFSGPKITSINSFQCEIIILVLFLFFKLPLFFYGITV